MKVYAVPFVSPVMVHEPDVPVIVQVLELGVAVIKMFAVVPPPPADAVIVAWASPAVAVGVDGASGRSMHGASAAEKKPARNG